MAGENGRLRRAMAMLSAVALLTLGAVVAASPARACACGAVLAGDGEQIQVDHEAAAVAWDGDTEDVILQMDMVAETDDAAVIIPTPAEPTVQLAQHDFFADLRAMAAPRQDVDYTWWPTSNADAGSANTDVERAGTRASDPPGATGPAPQGVELEELDAAIFAAADIDELTDWMHDRQYVVGDAMAAAMTPYVSEGWYFVAIHLQPARGALTGALQPIQLSFDTNSLIYPMRMSTAAHSAQDVTTYVIAQSQVRRTDPTAISTPATLQFAGGLEPDLMRSPTWEGLDLGGDYLTVINQHFSSPATQILSDFTFAAAPKASDYQQVVQVTKTRQILGLPVGPVLVVLMLLLGAAVLVYVLHRRTAHSAATGPGWGQFSPDVARVGVPGRRSHRD